MLRAELKNVGTEHRIGSLRLSAVSFSLYKFPSTYHLTICTKISNLSSNETAGTLEHGANHIFYRQRRCNSHRGSGTSRTTALLSAKCCIRSMQHHYPTTTSSNQASHDEIVSADLDNILHNLHLSSDRSWLPVPETQERPQMRLHADAR